jgi:arabinose-5-phosphate isomerase
MARYIAEMLKDSLDCEIAGLVALRTNYHEITAAFREAIFRLSHDEVRTVFLSGVGKSGHVCRKISSTLSSLGTPASFIHPTDAAHGDMGMISDEDALILMSRSGTAAELAPLTERAIELGLPIILISESADSFIGQAADVVIKLPPMREAWGHAPTTSTIMQMAIGDALAVALAESNGFQEHDFKRTHPGGALGIPK